MNFWNAANMELISDMMCVFFSLLLSISTVYVYRSVCYYHYCMSRRTWIAQSGVYIQHMSQCSRFWPSGLALSNSCWSNFDEAIWSLDTYY